eukprot:6281341-Ditylum_brightwellii.AAC.1
MGKGVSPYGNVTNLFQAMALYTPAFGQSTPYLHTVWEYMLIFATNSAPDKLFSKFSAVWLTLLYKVWSITDPNDIKRRPIGTGTGLRHCITAIVAKEESPGFARACLKSNNFDMGVHNGAHFVAFA